MVNESFRLWSEGKSISWICKVFNLPEESTLKRWFYPVREKIKQIKEKGYEFLRRIFYHVREDEKGAGSISEIYSFLENLSFMMENMGHIRRVPYHYALVLKK